MTNLLDYFKNILRLDLQNETQKAYFTWIVNNAKEVKCTSIVDIFGTKVLDKINNAKHEFKQNECYANAVKLCQLLDNEDFTINYVEGQIELPGICIGTEHAFNEVVFIQPTPIGGAKQQTYYIDITAEIVLQRTVSDIAYLSYKSFSYTELLTFLLKSKVYGGLFNEWIAKKLL